MTLEQDQFRIRNCNRCGTRMAGKTTAKKLGIRQYGMHGLCTACVSRDRRAGTTPVPMGSELNTPLGRHWREQARCGTADPRLFEENTRIKTIIPAPIAEAAEKYCRRCPVLAQCRAEADANPALRGLLGGVYRTLNLNTRKGQHPYRTFDLLAPKVSKKVS